MASAQDVRRRIVTVMTPVANIVAAQGAGGALRQVIEIAIDGYGRMPSAKAVAARHLQREGGSIDDAMSSIIDHHIRPRVCHQHRRPGCLAGSDTRQYHRRRHCAGSDGCRDRSSARLRPG